MHRRMKDLLSRLFTRPVREHDPAPAAEHEVTGEPATADPPSPAFGGLLGNVDEMMFVLDETARFAALSPPLLKLLGLREHEAIGRPAVDLFEGSPGWLAGANRAAVRFQCEAGVCYGAIVAMSPIPVGADQVEFRLALLSGVGVETEANLSLPPRLLAAARDCRADEFHTAVSSLLKSRPEPFRLSAGRIEVIGLNEVKAVLGARWPAAAARARAIARSVLSRRLGAEDVFSEIADDRYLICFGRAGVDEARRKAETIAREIRERLLGVTESPLGVEAQVERVTVRQSDLTEGQDLIGSLLRMMEEAREARRRADENRLADALRSATLELRPILARSLSATGLEMARLGDDCLSRVADLTVGEDGTKVAAELDALLLGLAATRICATPAGQALAIIVPVTYSTLHERRHAADYLALCQSLAPSVRSRLLFEVHGVAPDVPDLRLQDLLARLAPFSVHRLLRVSGLDHRFPELNRFRVGMVTIEARHADASAPATERKFCSLVSMVHANGKSASTTQNGGCRLLVHGIRDEADARWYAEHGADFLMLAAGERAPGTRKSAPGRDKAAAGG